VGDSDSKYGSALDEILLKRLQGNCNPVPDSGYFCLAYAMGLKRATARNHAVDTLIYGYTHAGFDAAAVGRHLGSLVTFPLFTVNNPMKVIKVVAAEGTPVARGLGATLEAVALQCSKPPRGLNKMLDVLTETRHAVPGQPMSDELTAWLEAQPKRGVIGKASKALLATK
jgi:hypothetical protein